MRDTDDAGETIDIEIEVPSLAFFADAPPPEEPGGSDMIAATLSDLGALISGRDPWSQVSGASARAVDGARAEGAARVSRFQFRALIPLRGTVHAFMLSVLRTYTALDGSGTRRKPTLHPTEQILIGVERTPQSDQDDHLQAPAWLIPHRPGAARFMPGVTIVRAATRAEGDAAATQGGTPTRLDVEIQGE